jgi:subtilisin family serine protease
MVHDSANWRMTARRVALALTAAALPLAWLDAPAIHAQNFMRSPTISVQSRIPNINPNVGPRINPNIAGAVEGVGRINPNVAGTAVTGVGRTSANLRIRRGCTYAYRDSDGQCRDQPVTSAGGGGSSGVSDKGKKGGARNTFTAVDMSPVAGHLVAEIDGSLTEAQVDALARRHGLARLESRNFPLLGATIGLFRITNRRSLESASRDFAGDVSVRSVQPDFVYRMQDQKTALTEGDPAQYALAKLRLPEAHTLAHGANVLVAVIDSGIDVKHPELADTIADNFDALGSKEGPHFHGTGIAGAIAAHARLMGSAPAARILAIRAFGTAQNGAEGTSYVVLKALDRAVAQGARIINMSFAGPKDPLIERGIAAAASRDIVMVAAAGNAGPKSPPLYPAANPNVIGVSATDNQDALFAASNRGDYVAVAAPGVDVFLPVPDGKYQMLSGTSFSAAYVSGVVALMLERNPALKPAEVRAIVMKTARDLGPPGRDDLFGAGEADAFAAVAAVNAVPQVAASEPAAGSAAENAVSPQETPPTRALNQPSAAMASGQSAAGEANRPAAQ